MMIYYYNRYYIMSKKAYKTLIVASIILIVIGVVVIPLIVNMLFNTPAKGIFIAKWTAADALSYTGDLLSFIGTISLGYVSVKQTEIANKMSESAVKAASYANELSYISRIIDYEYNSLCNVKENNKTFKELFEPKTVTKVLLDIASQGSGNDREQLALEFQHKVDINIHNIQKTIKRSLNGIDITSLNKDLLELRSMISEALHNAIISNNNSVESIVNVNYSSKFTSTSRFIDNYVEVSEELLLDVIYKEKTLDDIRKLYGN